MPRHIDVILKEQDALTANIAEWNALLAETGAGHKEHYESLIITAKAKLGELEREIASNPNPKVAITILDKFDKEIASNTNPNVAITIRPSKNNSGENNSGENNSGSSGGKRQKKRKSKKHMKSKKTTKGKTKKTRRKSTRRRR
jgi:hypothetical protein